MAKFNFTKTQLESLTPSDKTIYHQDAGGTQSVPGLNICVTPHGIKTFYLYRRIGNKPERVKLGRFPDMSVEQARRQTKLLLADIINGANPNEIKRAVRGEETFGEVFEDFIEHRRNKRGHPLAERTKVNYKSDFRLHLSSLGSQKLSTVSDDEMSRIYRNLGKAHPTAANRVRALAHSIFQYAIATKRIEKNPIDGVPKLFAENQRDRFLAGSELVRFLTALEQESNDTMRDLLKVALFTGARRSNVQAMRWEDIDFERAVWRIPLTKNGTPQNVPLIGPAMEVIISRKAIMTTSQFVFPGKGKSQHVVEPKSTLRRILDRDELAQLVEKLRAENVNCDKLQTLSQKESLLEARKMAEAMGIANGTLRIRNLRIHDLRRTLGSWQAITGASLSVIGKSLNHKSVQSTQIYARLDLDPVRASLEKAAAAMLANT